jgi:hypothetical protein
MNLERSFNDIQAKFSRYVAVLKSLSYSVLDVRETKWHEDYSVLKDNISDLEAMLTFIFFFFFIISLFFLLYYYYYYYYYYYFEYDDFYSF